MKDNGQDERNGTKRRFQRQIERKERRKLQARRDAGRAVWYGLGLMGLVGWAVSVPVLLGVAAGIWLDGIMDSGVSWTLSLSLMGFAIGCANAWYWVRRESRKDDRPGPRPVQEEIDAALDQAPRGEEEETRDD
jgi:ATP synthase protein I